MNVAVIGSGLASISAIKALLDRGVRPVVFDVGVTLDAKRQGVVNELSRSSPECWSDQNIEFLSDNPTLKNNKGLPKKLVFGSDYLYGESNKEAAIEGDDELPPFSYAKGGFSTGWGAAILPPDDSDIQNWPIGNNELAKYYSKVLEGLPYSAKDDGLSLNFPVIKENSVPLKLTEGNVSMLRDLDKARLMQEGSLVFGQSRLMVSAEDGSGYAGCKYCGHCMSGCVYGSIYKSDSEIDRLIKEDKIDYISGALVQKLEEVGGYVKVIYTRDGEQEVRQFDRVFLGAGALNSTRIVLQSKSIFDKKVTLKSRAGFVAPMLRLKKASIDWPNVNTQPGIFLEFKVDNLSNHWVHTQLSTPNEMVLQKLGIDFGDGGLLQSFKRFLAGHIVVAFCNMHSDHAEDYELSLKSRGKNRGSFIKYSRVKSKYSAYSIKLTVKKLFSISRKIGCYPVLPFIQNNTGSYHVGCTMPMKKEPVEETDTDLLGRPKGWERIHVVDSSVFPSLPGTTIGLLAMANARRIASEVEL